MSESSLSRNWEYSCVSTDKAIFDCTRCGSRLSEDFNYDESAKENDRPKPIDYAITGKRYNAVSDHFRRRGFRRLGKPVGPVLGAR